MKVLLVANTAWNIHNFRSGLIDAFQDKGYEVHAAAPEDNYVSCLCQKRVVFHQIMMDSQSTNPAKDLILFLKLLLLYRKISPHIILHFTIKPNIYGSVAAGLLGIPSISNITGLGNIILKGSPLIRIVKILYKVAFSFAARIFFQNPDVLDLFLRNEIVDPRKAKRLPGSGINTNIFIPREKSRSGEVVTFLLIARMIWEKGIKEYVDAARKVKRLYPQTCFQMIGETGMNKPSAIPYQCIQDWERQGYVTYLGFSDNIRSIIQEADCVVLPSYYREGTPRTLLEAASMAKPIITTDSVGCREGVACGENGFTVTIKDSNALCRAWTQIIEMDESGRAEMGAKSREKAIWQFDERFVVGHYLSAIQAALVY